MNCIRYSLDWLRERRHGVHASLPRNLRRRLFLLRILNPVQGHCENQEIPVRISRSRKQSSSEYSQKPVSRHNLVIPERQRLSKKRKSKKRNQSAPSLFLTNVRSVIGKIDEVGSRLRKHQPNIAILTETWLDASIPDAAISFKDYITIRKDRDRHGGGIVCFIDRNFTSNSFVPRVISSSDIPSISECSSELLPIVLPQLLLVTVYHPWWNSPSEHEKCISCIVDIVDFVFSSILNPCSAKLIVCGDFNGLRHHYRELADLLHVKALIDFPTRENNILDQVFTNFCVTKEARRLSAIGKSDHVSILWDQEPVSKPPVKMKVRCFSNANRAKFDNAMHTIDWQSLVESADSIDNAASGLLNQLFSMFDAHFPMKTIRKRHDDPPWMKPSLNILIDRRDRAFSEGKKLKYLRLRQEVIRHTNELKRRFMRDASSQRCSSKTWDAIKVLGRLQSHNASPEVCSAEEMNSFFSASFNDYPDSLTVEISETDTALSRPLRVTPAEVEKLLRSTRKKSPGPDGVPHWILKKYAGLLSSPVAFLFNRSFESGRVPSCFKEAIISPVPKKPRPSCLSDFRPISLLPLLSKIAEKIVAERWIKPVIRGRIQPDQFAYVPGPGKGTVAALTLLYHKVLHHLDRESGAVRLLSVDFSKAFDKLPHDVISKAMTKFNFPREAVYWISNFLSHRRQRTRINGALSTWAPVTSGVPQGSVIGPLLFCVVLDSLSPRCDNSLMIKYADDVTILHFVRTASDDSLQLEWDNITSWSNTTGLPVNAAKCAVMDFNTKKNLVLSPVQVSIDSLLPHVTSLRLLGVLLSCDMRWQSHVDTVLAKASKRFYIIRFLRKATCPSDTILQAYNALIRPLLTYCYPVLCNMPLYLFKKLVRLEKRACRIIGDAPRDPLLETGEALCERLFNQVLSNLDHPLRQCFLPRNSTLRNSCPLRPPLTRTARFKNSFIKFCS